jgi:hypothetical protein
MTQSLTALTVEQIKEKAPQVFANSPSEKVSDKYTFIPTNQIIQDMDQLGWKVTDAKCVRSKTSSGKEHGTHMVVFFNKSIFIQNDTGGVEAYPQILIRNNHTGAGSFKFDIGMFRMICSNGLVIKDKDLGSFNMRHSGYSFEDLKVLVHKAIEVLPDVVIKINKFYQKMMTPDEIKSFAEKAFRVRFGEERLATQYDLDEIVRSSRREDDSNSLWTVYNRTQENLISGGFQVKTKKKSRKASGIKSISRNVEINQKLWEIAIEYA